MPPRTPQGADPALPLENLAERIETRAGFRNPVIEQALVKGVRDQTSAEIETVETATGLTGAAQVGAATLALLEQTGQAAMAAHSRRVENERAMLDVQASLLGQAGQPREQRYTTNLRHQEFLMQLKAQEDARKASIAPSILGGLASAFVGSDAFSMLFAKEATE